MMKTKSILAGIFLFLLPSLCFSSGKKQIILGFGGGYSFPIDAALSNQVFNHYRQIYFEEEGRLKHSFCFNIQYYITQKIGFQLEFSRQKASYFSHLKWYGIQRQDMRYSEINHIEEPYKKTWSINSLTLSLLFANRRHMEQKMYPFISVGVGLYILSGDRDLVLNRFRLGPDNRGSKIKLGGGLKFRLGSKLGLNLRIYGETITRKYGRFREFLYVGPEQFYYGVYQATGKIVRVQEVFVRTFTYIGVDLSLEFSL